MPTVLRHQTLISCLNHLSTFLCTFSFCLSCSSLIPSKTAACFMQYSAGTIHKSFLISLILTPNSIQHVWIGPISAAVLKGSEYRQEFGTLCHEFVFCGRVCYVCSHRLPSKMLGFFDGEHRRELLVHLVPASFQSHRLSINFKPRTSVHVFLPTDNFLVLCDRSFEFAF